MYIFLNLSDNLRIIIKKSDFAVNDKLQLFCWTVSFVSYIKEREREMNARVKSEFNGRLNFIVISARFAAPLSRISKMWRVPLFS